MSFGARGRPIPVHGAVPGEWNRRHAAGLDGEVTLSVAPVALLGDVLGRVSRAIAAAAQFSLDRFSDLYLVTDEISAHVRSSAATGDIACSLTGRSGRLEMAIGPFRDGTVSALTDTGARTPYSFAKLVDELAVEPLDDGEMMRVVVVDRR
jgi:hypothetical protein